MNVNIAHSRTGWGAFLIIVFIGSASQVDPPAWSCWEQLTSSVHFNDAKPDFGFPPRPFDVSAWKEVECRPTSREQVKRFPSNGGDVCPDPSWGEDERLLREARRRERLGRFGDARRVYVKCVRLRIREQATAQDRIEVLGQVNHRTDLRKLKRCLSARDRYDAGPYIGRTQEAWNIMHSLYADKRTGFLRPHALYVLASIQYEAERYSEAARLYRRLTREFPGSTRREEALIMAARCLLTPNAFNPERDWSQVREAHLILYQLLEQFPRTRFRSNAVGWFGGIEFMKKRFPEALCIFLRQLAMDGPKKDRVWATFSIDSCLGCMGAHDLERFSRMLRANPSLAAAYLDFRLTHRFHTKSAEFDSTARLAETIVRRYPRSKLPPAVLAHLAEIEYHRGCYKASTHWASRALLLEGRSLSDSRHDLAYYVRGAARHKLYNNNGAISDFNTLLRRFPRSYLCMGARENLAILYEETGFLGKALEQYIALGYDADIAYLLDARMTPQQIESFLAQHPSIPQRALIRYSLGIRYLRNERWSQAIHHLRQVPGNQYRAFSEGRRLWGSKPSPNPLTAARELAVLDRGARQARTYNARAAALFRYGSYYHTHGSLLLYNSAIWRKQRLMCIDFWWNPRQATYRDRAALSSHMYQHDIYARSRKICLRVARRYPHSPVVPQALYRAACASEQLAFYNNWWRAESGGKAFHHEAVRLMKEVEQRYPRHPIAASARKYSQVFAREGIR